MTLHNPANLDPSLVGPNHKLLTVEELDKPLPEGAEFWSVSLEQWFPKTVNKVCRDLTYRIPLTLSDKLKQERPKVVCLCGSSKWPDVHHRVMMEETLAGRIVIPMGLYGHADYPQGAKAATNDGDEATEVKQMLDTLHHAKIDLADEILVVNVEGYVGRSTKREIEHAEKNGKAVRYLEPPTPHSIPWTLESHPDVVCLKREINGRYVHANPTHWDEHGATVSGAYYTYRELHSDWLQRNGEPTGEKVTS